jgi:hypothetical protein
MLGRLFGRTKDDRDDTVCSACGRHLLAGEWTQRVVDDDGSERYICALCARAAASPGLASSVIEPADDIATVTPGRVKPARADSDAFWRALKDKDAEIERLQAQLARAEAENQELVAQLARLRGESPAERRTETATEARPQTAEPASDIGAETIEYTPADLVEIGAVEAAPAPAERTDPHLGDALRAGDTWGDARAAAGAPDGDAPGEVSVFDVGDAAVEEHVVVPAVSPVAPAVSPFDGEATGELGHVAEAAALAQGGNGSSDEPAPDADDELVPLTILQRGVDLLNVSAVPKRIVETNEHLGIPQVHVGSENESALLITFMWSMGWYQFRVELEGAGRITLGDRGYDERVDLRPNASARNDGTVQLAPTRIKPPTPRESDSGSGDPATTGVTRGVIISKSMKGQRTDDENVPADWKTKSAPDFDWGR